MHGSMNIKYKKYIVHWLGGGGGAFVKKAPIILGSCLQVAVPERSKHHHHHHHISVMELVHLLTRSGLTYPEVSSKVCHDSFCQLWNTSDSLPWVVYYGAFYLHVLSSFSCIPVICPKLVLFLIPLQFV